MLKQSLVAAVLVLLSLPGVVLACVPDISPKPAMPSDVVAENLLGKSELLAKVQIEKSYNREIEVAAAGGGKGRLPIRVYEFRILKQWAGDAQKTLTVFTDVTSCGYHMPENSMDIIAVKGSDYKPGLWIEWRLQGRPIDEIEKALDDVVRAGGAKKDG